MRENFQLKKATADREQARIDSEAAQDIINPTLKVTPHLEEVSNQTSGLPKEQRVGLSVEAASNVGAGVSIDGKISGIQSKAGDTNYLPYRQLQLSVTQDLSRNLFGINDRLKAQASQMQDESARKALSSQQLTSCFEAANLYVETYYKQQSLALQKRNMKDSTDIYRYYQKFFREHRVPKVDLLRAKVSYLNSKSNLSQQSEILNQSMLAMAGAINESIPSTLTPPLALQEFEKHISKLQPTKNTQTQAIVASLSALKDQLELTKLNSRPSVELSGIWQQSMADELSNAGSISNTGTQSSKIQLSLSFPLGNNELRVARQKARISTSLEESKLAESYRVLSDSWKKLQAQKAHLKQWLSLSQEQLKTRNDQLIASKKLVRSLRLDLIDYLNDQQASAQFEQSIFDKELELYKTLFQLLQLQDYQPNFCKGES